jgi:hypothetical protein
MITDAAFPFFARRKRTTATTTTTQSRNLKDAPQRRRGLHLWRRRELTTFHKCLAVHMYYAAPQRAQK